MIPIIAINTNIVIRAFKGDEESAISIRKNFNLKVPDAIIAATAITKNLTLFSADDIFKRIPELNFVYVA